MKDKFGREIDYIRISITDRCNLRCQYCMPEEGIPKVSMASILTYEEILRTCRAAVDLGIRKFKITGGEPLVRKGCVDLCRDIKAIDGCEQVTLTSNGQLLEEYIDELKEAGVDGINVSLDSLDPDRYSLITRGGDLNKVMKGIEAAIDSGIKTKINCLLQKNLNEDELADFAYMAFDKGIDVRFIEIMPVGFGEPDLGLSNETVLRRLKRKWPELTSDDSIHGNGPAVYYHRPGQKGAIGLISALHGKFCSDCNRVRLTAQGKIKPCLCYEDSYDLRPVLEGGSADELRQALAEAIDNKPNGHTFENRSSVERKSMVEIGG